MILYGVAGWSYDDWHGTVYPRRKPPGFDPLAWLARFVDLVEINSSFYAPPQAAHAEGWVRRVEAWPALRFTAKLHRDFTHGAAGVPGEGAARAFRDGLAPLVESGRLEAVLVQFPAGFREEAASWGRLARIRDLFRDLRLVLEVRHRSWFEGDPLVRLATLGYGLVHVDLPAARDHPPAAHPSLGGLSYLRLHGRNRAAWFDPQAGRDRRYDHRYARGEVEELAERLRALADRSEKALLVANNHFGGKALAAALEIKGAVEGTPPLAPGPLLEAYPDLRGRVRVEGQQTLF